MSVGVNGSIENKTPYANDFYYCQPNSSTPWPTVAAAHAGMPIAYRAPGKKFMIVSDVVPFEEFWYVGGVDVSNIQTVIPRVYIAGFTGGSGTVDDPYILSGSSTGPTLTTPAAPTLGIVDDTANTFSWTNNASYPDLASQEYSINGGAYTTVTVKPIPIGDVAVAVGQLKVRIKAVSGVSYSSAALTNTAAFTVASGGGADLGTPVTAITYNNGGEVLNTNDYHTTDPVAGASFALGIKLNEGISGWVSQKYTGFSESGEASTAVMLFGIGLDPFYGGNNDSLIKMNGIASGSVLGYYNLGTSFTDANKIVFGSIIRGRFDTTTGYIEYSNNNGVSYTVLRSFVRPAGVIRVKIGIIGDQRFARDVRQSGFVAA